MIISLNDKYTPFFMKLNFEATNNIAKHKACIEMGIKEIKKYNDFILIISQISGRWKAKDEKLLLC